MKTIEQKENEYAFKYTYTSKDFILGNTMLTAGGLLLAEKGGQQILLNNVGSLGRVRGGGIYFLGIFNRPVKRLRWVNLGLPNVWIESSSSDKRGVKPGEAAFRINSHVTDAYVEAVNFRCGTWIDGTTGKKDWWKQVVQIRNVDNCELKAGKIIGPHELGAIEPGQIVKVMRYTNMGLTQMPKFTKVRESVKKVIFKGCYWIGEDGKPTGKKIVDQTW